MRVHQLASALGVSNDDLGDFLEGVGEKRSHLAGVSDESAELAREHFAEVNRFVPVPATDEDQAEFFEDGYAKPYADGVTTWEMLSEVGGWLDDMPTTAIPLDEPTMPAEDTFLLVETGEEFHLDPATAERLRAAIKGRQLANACVHLDRCEVIAVTWPDYQKITIRTEG